MTIKPIDTSQRMALLVRSEDDAKRELARCVNRERAKRSRLSRLAPISGACALRKHVRAYLHSWAARAAALDEALRRTGRHPEHAPAIKTTPRGPRALYTHAELLQRASCLNPFR